MDHRTPCVYILTNRRRGVLYTGVTSDLPGRIWQHRNKLVKGFTGRYNTDHLVWYEMHGDIEQAILREKRIKKWNRAWKIELIETFNLDWLDLYDKICG